MLSLRAIFLALLATACAAAPRPVRPWHLELASSGGIAGRGAGSYVLDSTGALTVTTMTRKQCSYQLSDAELQRVEKLLAAARLGTWKESYLPENTCCDRIEWDLTIDRAGTKRATKWLDEPPLPKDLVALVHAIVAPGDPHALASVYAERCRSNQP
ncbi:MAG: hypothetical protein JO197_07260 [Acidobacteria bacterium]|nr:hypothetical protein [Acidobacteriota bacterium]MBV9475808.1 hypothetical protein [Acidobacteriota bacterium]